MQIEPASDQNGSTSRDTTYFGYYSQLSNQQNMLQDVTRTNTYRCAVLQNKIDFQGKVVLDVGTGSGILAFFAIQAGAEKVYAVEASDMAHFAKKLVEHNKWTNKIEIIQGKLEDVKLPEKVDLIISEPMGVFLVHERMIETYLIARNNFLKQNGKMFPGEGSIFVAPFTDAALYQDTINRARFWQQSNFYDIDISCLSQLALEHLFSQPVVGTFAPNTLLSSSCKRTLDFNKITLDELKNFTIPFSFTAQFTGIVHGLATWFDVSFLGTESHISLSTSPFAQATHWYQTRLLFKNPVALNIGQTLAGKLVCIANEHRSYNITIEYFIEGTSVCHTHECHLEEQTYSYLNSYQSSSSLGDQDHHRSLAHDAYLYAAL